MTTELYVLTLAGLLQVVQLLLYTIIGNAQLDRKTAFGPRDDVGKLPIATGRMDRVIKNHTEGLVMFAIAAIVVTLTDQSSPVTQGSAHVYLIARLLYVPAYLQGLAPWRSLIWSAGFAATVTMLIAALI